MAASYPGLKDSKRVAWRKRVLLPCWFIIVALTLGLIIIFAYRLSETIHTWEEEEQNGHLPHVELIWECTNVGFSFVSFMINALQIAKFIAEALTPLAMMFGNIISLVLSVAVLVLDVVQYASHSEREYSIIALAMDVLLLVFTIVPTIYGTMVYRQSLKFEDYHQPHNAKLYGLSEETVTSYGPPRISIGAASDHEPYDPTDPNPHPQHSSFTFPAASELPGEERGGSLSPPPMVSLEQRRASGGKYNHKRDTSFEEYMARRTDMKEGVDRAMGAEFGWVDDGSRANRVSVLGSGNVPSLQTTAAATTRPRGNSANRAPSWEVQLSGLGGGSADEVGASSMRAASGSGSRMRGHSLNSVPEAREEEDAASLLRRKSGKAPPRPSMGDEDREGLLSIDLDRDGDEELGQVGSRGASRGREHRSSESL